MKYDVTWACRFCGEIVEQISGAKVPESKRVGCVEAVDGKHKFKPIQATRR